MNAIINRLKANEARAEHANEERLKAIAERNAYVAQRRREWQDDMARRTAVMERAELVRQKARELAGAVLDPERNGGLPVDEVLLAMLNYCAGSLACLQLDEPASLKVRRLGRTMDTNPVVF